MEVSTAPTRWKYLRPQNAQNTQNAEQDEKSTRPSREERFMKTDVRRLNYYKSGDVKVNMDEFKTSDALSDALNPDQPLDDSNVQLRLYVVQDLSRDVIELLGYKYDIDPAFFRSHIVDFAWCNVRDPWRDLPSLIKDSKKQNWTGIRFVTARYFESSQEFKNGSEEAEGWNISRRPDDDNNKAFWDKPDAIVALTRSKASFWLQRPVSNGSAAIGGYHVQKILIEHC